MFISMVHNFVSKFCPQISFVFVKNYIENFAHTIKKKKTGVRNGGYSAGFDGKNQVTIFNKKSCPLNN